MEKIKRPIIIAIISGVLIAQSFIFPILIFAFLMSDPNSTMNYNGEEVLIGDYKSSLSIKMFIGWIFIACIGFGLWHAKNWSRFLVAGFYIFVFIYSIITAFNNVDILWLITSLSLTYLTYWYFFKKDNVRAYFNVT